METINASSIFSRASGLIKRSGFDWTCNPYLGCTFGCEYCYAKHLPQNQRPQEEWGRWFQAKINAVELARQQAKKLAGKAVYLSSVTDPYQPVERGLCLTRGILEAIAPYQPLLVIQTRSPLVMRDADVIGQFESVRVNFSIPTDSEEVRKSFEPKAPPIEGRLAAAKEVSAAGIAVGISICPMLPIVDVDDFIARIDHVRPDVVLATRFHDSRGRFGADTSEAARERMRDWNWTDADHVRCVTRMRRLLPSYGKRTCFAPPQTKSSTPRQLSLF